MTLYSPLEQERRDRGWSRAYVEERFGIPHDTLSDAEKGKHKPRQDLCKTFCTIYEKTPEQLGLGRNGSIIVVGNINAPASQGETPIMSDLIRRFALSDLGSYLIGLVSTWPRRNHYYRELREGINKAIIDHTTLVGQDAISALNRRQALMSLGLVPIQLIGAHPITDAKKADADTLLPHCAAGIIGCWYLRRGKDLIFVSDLTSS